jgi:hypothetical protein
MIRWPVNDELEGICNRTATPLFARSDSERSRKPVTEAGDPIETQAGKSSNTETLPVTEQQGTKVFFR